MKYRVINKKTKEDITHKFDWVITPDGKLSFDELDDRVEAPFAEYVLEENTGLKSEVVKDIFKYLEQKCKEQKKKVDEAEEYRKQTVRQWGCYDDTQDLIADAKIDEAREQAKLEALVEVKVSVEKYMKKLRHQGE